MAAEIFLILIIHFLLVYGVIITSSGYLNYPIIITNVTWLSIQTLVFSLLLVLYTPFLQTACFNNFLFVDTFGVLVKSIVLTAAILTGLISIKYNQFERVNSFESVILILLAITGILLLVSSFDLLTIYLAIELQSFCLYILAALNRNSEFSTEAGLKYFILGAFSSGLLLFGFSLLYGFTGAHNLLHVGQFLSVTSKNTTVMHILSLASIFILVAVLFKLSVAPFHLWVSDIYEGAPTSITSFFAIVPKISILALLTRFSYIGFYDMLFSWQELLITAAILSIAVGSLAALVQVKLKRLFAYSTISHMGYIMIGLCSGSFEGLQATYLYMLIYIIMTVACFITLLGFYKKKNLVRLNFIKDLTIVKKSNVLFGLLFTVTLFSMAGIPPLAGFFSKMFLFVTAIQSKIYVVAVIGVLFTLISCFYYIRLIKLAYFDVTYKWCTFVRFDREKSFTFTITSMLLVFVGVYPTLFIYKIHNSLFFIVK